MTIGARLTGIAMLAGAAWLLSAAGGYAQDNVCAAQDKRQACSFQCCGRRSCPPSCEVDCVKVCVDACSAPDRALAYGARKRELQIRCGNKGATGEAK
jgi:hypothetical protein